MVSAKNEPTILILDDIEIKWTLKESELLHSGKCGMTVCQLMTWLRNSKRIDEASHCSL
ncbi:hypothetical protein [Sporosarcina sp. P34]|uniref:hypothetical protein n=1 Tax=Sporosarcina sp. P34 TaxID=2048247 RepID=UPI0013040665|nr:hypothetical protein [Sporosarcina sp. P34]